MKKILPGVYCLLALVACFAFGLSWRDLQRGEVPKAEPFLQLVGYEPTPSSGSPENVFRQNYSRILSTYIKPVESSDLKYAGMSGLLASLGDPHTSFMVPQMAKEFVQETRGNFVGIGARLSADPLGAKVMTVFESGPAFGAGLKEGDIISGVDGKTMTGVDVNEIVRRIRGEEGTQVELTVVRSGQPKPLNLRIRRAQIVTPTVDAKYLPDSQVGVLSVMNFSEPTAEQFDSELERLEKRGLKGLVIDMRNNPGGLLTTATDMLARFVEGKVVITMKSRNGSEEVVRTPIGQRRPFPYPIVVLVNEDSASAAEIFTGVLRDYGLATVVGTHTYGKASVQNIFPFIDSTVAKITVARYYLPSNRDISRRVDEDGAYLSGGLEPDVKVELDLDNEKLMIGDPKTDNQLIRAIDVLKGKVRPATPVRAAFHRNRSSFVDTGVICAVDVLFADCA